MAHDVDDVVKVMAYGRRTGVPVTFRAAGTSLNGQAQGDGIMVDVRRHWRGVQVEDDGARARVLPGTVLGHANAMLAPHGRRLGPDPGLHGHRDGRRSDRQQLRRDALRRRARLLPDGALADVRAAVGHRDRHGARRTPRQQFAAREPELARGLVEIRDEIRADTELSERIRRKFEIKNTMGYRLVAFLDADTPLEIFRRLIVGSEGTLAFVAEAVFDTVPFGRHATTAFVLFPAIDEAVACVPPAGARPGASATELMMVLWR